MEDGTVTEKKDQLGITYSVWKTFANLKVKENSRKEILSGSRDVSQDEARRIADAMDQLGWDLRGIPKKKLEATCLHNRFCTYSFLHPLSCANFVPCILYTYAINLDQFILDSSIHLCN